MKFLTMRVAPDQRTNSNNLLLFKALRKPSGGLRQSFKYTNYMVILLRKPIVSQVVEWFHFKRSENQNKVLRMKTKFVLNLNSSQSWSSSKQMKDQKSERQKSQNHLTQNQMKSRYQYVVLKSTLGYLNTLV